MNPGKIRGKIVITAGLMLMTALPQGVFAADGALTQTGSGTGHLQQNGSAVCSFSDADSLYPNRTYHTDVCVCGDTRSSGRYTENTAGRKYFCQKGCWWKHPSHCLSGFCGFEGWLDNEGEDTEKDETILQPENGENGNNGSGSVTPPENSGTGNTDSTVKPENGGTGNTDSTVKPENGGTGNTDSVIKPENNGTGSTGNTDSVVKPENENAGSSGIQQDSSASQVIRLVNQERSAAGLPSLSYDPELTELAQLKAEDMAKNGYFSHQSPTYGSAFDMMRSAGLTYRSAGENIARGQKTAAAVMNSWMNSQGHKENILSTSYTSIGVGYAADSSGRICWVQMFRG